MQAIRHFQVTLTTQEPFRIGALTDVMSGIDNPVATVGGRPVVQGSSLKGALRSAIEDHLIGDYKDVEEMKPCIPSAENTLSPDERKLIEMGKYRKGGGCFYSMRRQSPSICPVCYLLGANGLSGFVRVPYLYSDKSPEDLYAVRIDRASGTVAERTNRDYQIMPDKTVFLGTLEVMVDDPRRSWKLGEKRPIGEGREHRAFLGDRWLQNGDWDTERIIEELIVDRLKDIAILGGFKSRGCGKVAIEVA